MKLASMFSDVVTALRQRPATEAYPLERPAPNPRLRGLMVWEMSACSGCGLCAMDCPAEAIEVHVIDRKARRIVIRYFGDRCTFCAQCIHSCRQGSIHADPDGWELAVLDRGTLEYDYGDPQDVQSILAERTQAKPA